MALLRELVQEMFGDRRYLLMHCSEPPENPFFWPSAERYGRGSVAGLPDETQSAVAIGLYPIMIVEWDLRFDANVSPEEFERYLIQRDQTAPEGNAYRYHRAYVNLAVRKRLKNRWAKMLYREKRRMGIHAGLDRELRICECRPGERLVSIYLGLEPIPGQPISA